MSLHVSDLARAGLLLALAGAVPTHADTLTQVVDLGLVSANTSTDWVYDQFDPTLGTLESVTLEFEGSFLNGFRFANPGSASSFQIDFTEQASVLGPNGEVIYSGSLLSNSFNATMPPSESFSAQHQGHPHQNQHHNQYQHRHMLPAETFSGSYTWEQTLDLEDFTGTDTVSIPFLTSASYDLAVDGGMGGVMGGTKVQTTAILTYVYSPVSAPVPEPETYLMLLAGLGVMWVRMRRAPLRKNNPRLLKAA